MYVHNKASNNRFVIIELSIMRQITECPNKKYSDKDFDAAFAHFSSMDGQMMRTDIRKEVN